MAGHRWWASVLAVALMATACSSNGSAQQESPPTAPHSTPQATPPTTDSVPSQSVSDEARLYAAALGGPDRGNVASKMRRVTYLIAHFCTGMIAIDRRGPCNAGPIAPGLQRELLRVMGPGLRITDNPPQPQLKGRMGGTVIVQFGSADVHGNEARVAVDYRCGPLCGQGETLVLTRTGEVWTITGHTGRSWIS
jgi:hypothetical protein